MRTALVVLCLAACRAPSTSPTVLDAARPGQETTPHDAEAPHVLDVPPPAPDRDIGPFELPFERGRSVYFVAARSTRERARLIANLHGVCNPPGYACGYWTEAAASRGFLICPEGNSRCGPSGPPTWTEPFTQIDKDLEKAIATVDARYPDAVDREGAVLTGFSLGATAAYAIARAHPGRWPYLVLVEANVALDRRALETAGVRAVAMLAGERGSQLAGERRTVDQLAQQGYPARLWVMKGAGHHYSADIDALMAEALAFVTAER
jgi:hypothetical protein